MKIEIINNGVHDFIMDKYLKVLDTKPSIKEMEDINEKLDHFRVCARFNSINMYQQLLLKSIGDVSTIFERKRNLSFCELSTNSDVVKDMYHEVLAKTENVVKRMRDSDVREDDIYYITPLSRQTDCIVEASARNFVKLIKTMMLHSEFHDMFDMDYVKDDVISKFIDLSPLAITPFTLYSEPMDHVTRWYISDMGRNGMIIGDLEPVKSLLSKTKCPYIGLYKSIMSTSFVACNEMLLVQGMERQMRFEDVGKVLLEPSDYEINLNIPDNLINGEFGDEIRSLVYDWTELSEVIRGIDSNSNNLVLTQLGSLMLVYSYNTNVGLDRQNIDKCKDSLLSEVREVMDKRLHELSNSILKDYYINGGK